ncbi:non-ribosomal peptide synthetase, partial [Pseudoalteromonas piscicida]
HIELDGLVVNEVPNHDDNVKYDLELTVTELADGLELSWTYSRALFEAQTITRVADNFAQLITSTLQAPSSNLASLTYMSKEQEALLLEKWSGKSEVISGVEHLLQAYQQQVELFPEQIAVCFEKQSLTYKAMDEKANQLAHALLSRGCEAGDVIGVALPRSVDMVVAIVAILKTGAAYTPLDLDLPDDRLLYLLQNSGAQVVVTTEAGAKKLPTNGEKLLCIDSRGFGEEAERLPVTAPPIDDAKVSQQLAYVIYTSGSTGNPKGVKVNHKAIAAHIMEWGKILGIQPGDRVLQVATVNFDTSVEQIFVSLSFGGKLCIVEPKEMSVQEVWHYLREQRINFADFTPSYFNTLVSAGSLGERMEQCELKAISLGGESFTRSIADAWDKYKLWSHCRLINAYGPTEATVTSTYYELNGNESGVIPIGYPVPGKCVYVVAEDGTLCPPGVVGELCLGGPNLAEGYLGMPQASEEKFTSSLFKGDVGRVYRTGDLVRFDALQRLEFIGRIDEQVKVRGYRIELEEISSALMNVEGVNDAVALVKSTQNSDFLAAYIVLEAGQKEQMIAQCQAYLKGVLPPYMQPATYNVIESVPLTTNGKVDKKALPTPEIKSYVEWQAPESAIELELAAIWAQVLDVDIDTLSLKDDFFMRGGQSLLLMKLVTEIKHQFQFEIAVKDLFTTRTLAEQAAFLSQRVEEQALLSQVTGENQDMQDLNELVI